MIARFLLTLSVAAILTPSILAQTEKAHAIKEFRSQDGNRAEVLPVGKLKGYEDYESRIEFYSANGKKMCSADYSSADSDHGFGVARAEWTPDGRYFVYSMTSSGGHSPWHTPTMFFARSDQQLCILDEFLDDPGITTADFELIAPNSIKTSVYNAQSEVVVSLDSLLRSGDSHGHPRCVPCNGGVVHEFGDKTQPEHSPK